MIRKSFILVANLLFFFGVVLSPALAHDGAHPEDEVSATASSEVSIVVQNTLGEGVTVDGVLDWLIAHYHVLISENESKVQERWASMKSHPASDLIQQYDPTILILHEIMPNLEGSKTYEILEASGYHLCASTPMGKKESLRRATVIGSKLAGEVIPSFTIDGSGGGGFCGFYIPEIDTAVFAVHPSAFNATQRMEQLGFIASQLEEYKTEFPDRRIVLAGDFNDTYKNIEPFFSPFTLQHFGGPTFPKQSLLDELQQYRWTALRLAIFSEGMRDIDHMFIPNDWRMEEFKIFESNSDHLGLYGRMIVQ